MADFLSSFLEGYAGGRDKALERQARVLNLQEQQFNLQKEQQQQRSEQKFESSEGDILAQGQKQLQAIMDNDKLSEQHRAVLEARQEQETLSNLLQSSIAAGDHAESDRLLQQMNAANQRLLQVQKDRVREDVTAATTASQLAQSVLDAAPEDRAAAFERAKAMHAASGLFDQDDKDPFAGDWDAKKTPGMLQQVATNGMKVAQDKSLQLREKEQQERVRQYNQNYALAVKRLDATNARFTATLNRLTQKDGQAAADKAVKSVEIAPNKANKDQVAGILKNDGADADAIKDLTPAVIQYATMLKAEAFANGQPLDNETALTQAAVKITDPGTGLVEPGALYGSNINRQNLKNWTAGLAKKMPKGFAAEAPSTGAGQAVHTARPEYTQDNPARPASEAEFKDLPSGSWFIAPDGKKYRKD